MTEIYEYEVVKDVRNDKWAIRKKGKKDIIKSYPSYSTASRICQEMNDKFKTEDKDES
jgi:hypothetical protein